MLALDLIWTGNKLQSFVAEMRKVLPLSVSVIPRTVYSNITKGWSSRWHVTDSHEMLLPTNVIDLWLSISILIFYYSLPRNDLKLLLQCRTSWPQSNYAAFYVVLLYCAPLNYLIQQSLIFFNTSAILSLLKSQLSQKLYCKLTLISPLPFIYKHTPVISLSSWLQMKKCIRLYPLPLNLIYYDILKLCAHLSLCMKCRVHPTWPIKHLLYRFLKNQ